MTTTIVKAMKGLSQPEPTSAAGPKSRARRFVEELVLDVLITTAIVWGLVLIGEPLFDVFRSPLFIILTGGGLIYLIYKTFRRQDDGAR